LSPLAARGQHPRG